jgi:hypothetical protein
MTPCPDCKNVHMHRVGCLSPIVLPQLPARTEAATVYLIESRVVLAMEEALTKIAEREG